MNEKAAFGNLDPTRLFDQTAEIDATHLQPCAEMPCERIPAISGFQIERELGRGGMGVVYAAFDSKRQRRVAIKMMLSHVANQKADVVNLVRFRLDMEAIASLRHPNVVRIHEIGMHERSPFMVLEFAEPGTLADLVRGGPMDPREAAKILHATATGVGHAHERGVIHRDLKPSNVLVMSDGTPKVSDFGLSRFDRPYREVVSYATIALPPWEIGPSPESFDKLNSLLFQSESPDIDGLERLIPSICPPPFVLGSGAENESANLQTLSDETVRFVVRAREQFAEYELQDRERINLTRTDQLLGTPRYMAPEQLRNPDLVGPRSDVYALGCILFELLTGRPMMNLATLEDILQAAQEENRPDLPDNVPRDLGSIYRKSVRRDPLQRYANAREFASDLGKFLGGNSISVT